MDKTGGETIRGRKEAGLA